MTSYEPELRIARISRLIDIYEEFKENVYADLTNQDDSLTALGEEINQIAEQIAQNGECLRNLLQQHKDSVFPVTKPAVPEFDGSHIERAREQLNNKLDTLLLLSPGTTGTSIHALASSAQPLPLNTLPPPPIAPIPPLSGGAMPPPGTVPLLGAIPPLTVSAEGSGESIMESAPSGLPPPFTLRPAASMPRLPPGSPALSASLQPAGLPLEELRGSLAGARSADLSQPSFSAQDSVRGSFPSPGGSVPAWGSVSGQGSVLPGPGLHSVQKAESDTALAEVADPLHIPDPILPDPVHHREPVPPEPVLLAPVLPEPVLLQVLGDTPENDLFTSADQFESVDQPNQRFGNHPPPVPPTAYSGPDYLNPSRQTQAQVQMPNAEHFGADKRTECLGQSVDSTPLGFTPGLEAPPPLETPPKLETPPPLFESYGERWNPGPADPEQWVAEPDQFQEHFNYIGGVQ
ncbi:hypothetical protein GNI_150750 [Gregarina niphandrodes]|uniref:Uncharacterized protein n=1 Tax=Gregarina niphandrodes TaxID=110365 RepID=A0A023AZG9_GRENI|nr:hypothetical protein GNI_150750 [Gregarina niphandrodes]EZG44197.1 hypothetical protein GNI_150750 [Gregarina niphandrodes]|eukprot:XP_011132765.1 hypothetical protein GNI_150750 [Gregarina niphandrodes]